LCVAVGQLQPVERSADVAESQQVIAILLRQVEPGDQLSVLGDVDVAADVRGDARVGDLILLAVEDFGFGREQVQLGVAAVPA
jgi:hypothetical protein